MTLIQSVLAVLGVVVAAALAGYFANRMSGSAGRTASASEVTALSGSLQKEREERETLEGRVAALESGLRASEARAEVYDGRARSWAVHGHAMARWYADPQRDQRPMPDFPDNADPWTGALIA